jgi:predicted Fe-S protein YdhL (DUF1289 family)
MSGKKAKNPCVDICKMDKTTGLCIGCLRTKAEIKGWKGLSKSERRTVIEQTRSREIVPPGDRRPL